LLINALNRADKLAVAMEARGYVIGKKRTKYKEMRLGRRDYISVAVSVLIMLIAIGIKGKI